MGLTSRPGHRNVKSMISLLQAKRSDRLMNSATSLTVAEFDALARKFAPSWSQLLYAQIAEGASRNRKLGAGRKGALAFAERRLYFILFYYQVYSTQDLMGLLFGFTPRQVSDWVGLLTRLVGGLMSLHKPARHVRVLGDLLAWELALKEVIIYGKERGCPAAPSPDGNATTTAGARSGTLSRTSASRTRASCGGVPGPCRPSGTTKQ